MHVILSSLTLIIQFLGIIFFNWDISDVIFLYLIELVILGIVSAIKILFFPTKNKGNSIVKIALSLGIKLYAIFFFIMSYGFMVLIGGLVAIYASQYNSPNLINANPLIQRLTPALVIACLLLLFNYSQQTISDIRAIRKNVNKTGKILVYPYIELGVFLVVLIAFFLLGGLFNTEPNKWFSICFIVIKGSSDLFVKKYIMSRFS